jgi:hypothetical protein
MTGELKEWHKVKLTLDGPKSSETAEPNSFLYCHLNVLFTHTGSRKSYVVPGRFATDGNTANTSADNATSGGSILRPTNAFSFLTLNVQGDDQNVFPSTTYDGRL